MHSWYRLRPGVIIARRIVYMGPFVTNGPDLQDDPLNPTDTNFIP